MTTVTINDKQQIRRYPRRGTVASASIRHDLSVLIVISYAGMVPISNWFLGCSPVPSENSVLRYKETGGNAAFPTTDYFAVQNTQPPR
jgi:hypothetical protein